MPPFDGDSAVPEPRAVKPGQKPRAKRLRETRVPSSKPSEGATTWRGLKSKVRAYCIEYVEEKLAELNPNVAPGSTFVTFFAAPS